MNYVDHVRREISWLYIDCCCVSRFRPYEQQKLVNSRFGVILMLQSCLDGQHRIAGLEGFQYEFTPDCNPVC